MMKGWEWVVIVRYGEISVKGPSTRKRMENLLVNNIRDSLASNNYSGYRVRKERGRIYVEGVEGEKDAYRVSGLLTKVMGIVSLSPSVVVSFTSLEDLVVKAWRFFRERIRGSSFAVRAHRIGEHGFTSLDVQKKLGAIIHDGTGIRVDLENPDYTAYLEIRGWKAYLYDTVLKGPGGLPIGSEGRVLALFSGGIDSPVAAWYMLKRGCIVDLVLFNIGGEEQVRGATEVARRLMGEWGYGYTPRLYIVDIRRLIPRIAVKVPRSYIVIVIRRLMMRLASILAEKIGAKALVTGESLGQVASQTLDNLYVIDRASSYPVLRPLIGFDKEEITRIARLIGTYELSARMKEFCMIGTRRIVTHSSLKIVEEYEAETGITWEELVELVDKADVIELRTRRGQ